MSFCSIIGITRNYTMNKNRISSVKLLFIVIGIIGIGVGAWYIWGQSNTFTQDSTLQDWTQYSSDSNDFSFEYPKEWQIQTTGDGEGEIVQLFSEEPQRNKNIYMCVDIRKADELTISGLELLEKTTDELSIYRSDVAEWDNSLFLASEGEKDRVLVAPDTFFRIRASYNCGQGDNEVIEGDEGFIFQQQDEYTQALMLLSSFRVGE